jgi:excinuclease ABC subunit B
MANVIARFNKPTMILSHNKTLAAQLYSELKAFFPDNAVEFFISYYDYYQPEAYIPQTDTHIEKDASINEEIERMRLSATNSILGRDDVIVVASVSCIYGLGSPDDYRDMVVKASRGQQMERDAVLRKLVDIQYSRNDYQPEPGTFRVRGDTIEIYPSYATDGVRLEFFGDEIEAIRRTDSVTGNTLEELQNVVISPAKHFVLPDEKIAAAIELVMEELDERVKWFESHGKLLEAQRVRQRTRYDMEMMREMGYCSGIENYSRHLSGRGAGEPPATLLSYFRDEFLTIIDESHVAIPQLRAMYNGDQARKGTLVEHGFRLPSAMDNRPLAFEEFLATVGPIVFTTATPGPFELQESPEPVTQVIRPTGLLEPQIDVRPLNGQIDDLIEEVRAHAERGQRVLVTTLTKRTSEDLTDYLRKTGLRVEYLHSDVSALDRVDILRGLRRGDCDCLIGINLLREGLDLPEVSLVAVLDADKEGFLRSETALLQTAGRASRHLEGKVIMYADTITGSMQRMMDVTASRRQIQLAYNQEHNVTPRTIVRELRDPLREPVEEIDLARSMVRETGVDYDVLEVLNELKGEMLEAADAMEFERAAAIRDQIRELEREEPSD